MFESIEGIRKIARVKMPELPVAERIKSFDEVDQVIDEKEALSESDRCLFCGRICYNKDEDAAA